MGSDEEPRAGARDDDLGSAYAPPGRSRRLTDNPTMLGAAVVVVLAVVLVAVLLALG